MQAERPSKLMMRCKKQVGDKRGKGSWLMQVGCADDDDDDDDGLKVADAIVRKVRSSETPTQKRWGASYKKQVRQFSQSAWTISL